MTFLSDLQSFLKAMLTWKKDTRDPVVYKQSRGEKKYRADVKHLDTKEEEDENLLKK